MKRAVLIVLFLLTVTMFSEASKFNRIIYPIKTKDASGYELKQEQPPQRIISGSPAITEILFAIYLEDKIVGVSDDSDYPDAAKKIEKIGRDKLNKEKLLKLKPDLVIIPLGSDKGYLEELRKLTYSIDVSGEAKLVTLEVFAVDPKSLADVFNTIDTISTITNKEHSAYSLTQRMRRRIEWVTSRAMKEKRMKALMLTSKRPIIAAGDGTYQGDLLRAAGFTNVATKGEPFSKMKRQEIEKADPDIIISNTGVARSPKDLYNNRSFRKTGAGKNKRGVCVDKELLLRPGPRLADALDQIARSAYGWPQPDKGGEGSEIEQTKE